MRDVALPPAPTRRLTTRRHAPGTATPAAGAAGAAAGFSVVPFLAVLLPLLDRSEPPSLVLGLAGTGLLALVAAGLAPVALVPGLRRGRREAVLPALLVGAGLGAVAVLLSTLLPGTAGPAGARLRLLAPYFAATMAGLGLAQDLGQVGDRQLGLGQEHEDTQPRVLTRRLQGSVQGVERQVRGLGHGKCPTI